MKIFKVVSRILVVMRKAFVKLLMDTILSLPLSSRTVIIQTAS